MAGSDRHMSLRIAPFDGTPAEWDAVADREWETGATLCHRFAWRPLIEETFGHECFSLAARDDAGSLQGILPLVRVRSRLFGHYLVSMPFLNAGGPVGTPEAIEALAAHARDMALADRVDLLELRSVRELPVSLEVSHRKITVVLPLPDDPMALVGRFPAKLRSQVRRAEKEGVEVRFGPDQVAGFYRVFSRHMRDLGTPVLPRRFFDALVRHFPAEVLFGVSWLGDEPIAAGCGFRWHDTFEITWASALAEHNRIAANMGLYRAFMERVIGDGVREFDFGRCTPGSGTHRFKKQWGSEDRPLWWYQVASRGAAGTPSPDAGGALSLGPRLWRHLPLPVANRLGPLLVRSIP